MNSKKYSCLLLLPVLALTSCAKTMSPEEVATAIREVSKTEKAGAYKTLKASSTSVLQGGKVTTDMSVVYNKDVGSKISVSMKTNDVVTLKMDITVLNEEDIAYVATSLGELNVKAKMNMTGLNELLTENGMPYDGILSACSYEAITTVFSGFSTLEGITGKADGSKVSLSYESGDEKGEVIIEDHYLISVKISSKDEASDITYTTSDSGKIAKPSDADKYLAE